MTKSIGLYRDNDKHAWENAARAIRAEHGDDISDAEVTRRMAEAYTGTY